MKLIRGLAALLMLVAILVGIPAALLIVGAGALPSSLPTLGDITTALTQPDSGELFIGFLVIVAWAAWAYFAIAIIAEVLALRRPELALPGFDWGRSVVGSLVAAVAAMIAVGPLATASAVPLDTTSINARVAAHTTQSLGPAQSTADRAAGAAAETVAGTSRIRTDGATAAAPADDDLRYEVQRGDSAWGLAERFYRDGARYKEILAANPQIGPEGWLEVGDTLTIPGGKPKTERTARAEPGRGSGDATVTVQQGDTLAEIADKHLGDPDRWPEIAAKSGGITQPDGGRLTDPNHIEPGWKVVVPGKPGAIKPTAKPEVEEPAERPTDKPTAKPSKPVVRHARPTVEPTAKPSQQQPTQQPTRPVDPPVTVSPTDSEVAGAVGDNAPTSAHEGDGDLVPSSTALGAGAILCAGIIAAVGRNRRRQLRQREPGQQIPQPPPAAAEVEREMRAIAGPLKLDHLDRALRTLAYNLAEAGSDLPALRYVILSRARLCLYLDTANGEAATKAPPPFSANPDGSVWILERTATHQLLEPRAAAEVPAPYPALVSVGRDAEDQIVLLDLEHIGGLTITADGAQASHMIAGLGAELALSLWADDLLVTLVGSHPELPDAIGADRARYVDTPTALFANLRTRIAADRSQLVNNRHLSAAQARRNEPADWQPEVILFGVDLTDDERDELISLVTTEPRPALAAVTISGEPLAGWTITSTSPSAARIDPLDMPIAPQLLRGENYTATLQVLQTSQRTDTTPAPWWDHTKPTAAADTTGQSDSSTAQITELRPTPHPAQEHADGLAESADLGQAAAQTDTGATSTSPQPAPGKADAQPATDPIVAQPDHAPHDRALAQDPVNSMTTPSTMLTTPAASPAAATVHRLPAPVPSITLFGEPTIHRPADDVVDPARIGPLTRMAVYLVLFPHSTGAEIDKALFISANTRASAISRLRKWLGQTPEGELYVPKLGRRFALHKAIRTDWDRYQELIIGGVNTAPTAALVDALRLVGGPPIAEPEIDRYDFAQSDREEMTAVVRDTAHELANRSLASGDIDQARWAIQRGYLIDPDDECLARDEIRTERLANNRPRVREVVNRLVTRARKDGVDLDEATTRLLHDVRRAFG